MLEGPDTGEECHAQKVITQQQDQTTKTHGLTSHSITRMCLGEHKSDHFCLKPLTAFPQFLGKRPKPFSWSTRTSAHFSSLFLIYALPLPPSCHRASAQAVHSTQMLSYLLSHPLHHRSPPQNPRPGSIPLSGGPTAPWPCCQRTEHSHTTNACGPHRANQFYSH